MRKAIMSKERERPCSQGTYLCHAESVLREGGVDAAPYVPNRGRSWANIDFTPNTQPSIIHPSPKQTFQEGIILVTDKETASKFLGDFQA